MSNTIDLDALLPPTTIIKFGGRDIEIAPPKTGDVLKLGQASQQLTQIDEKTGDEVNAIIADITQIICTIVPDLAGATLSTAQLLLLIKIISDMAIPPDSKELQKRGITVGDTDPKDQ